MQVKLINYTIDALETLLYTKNTRLQAAASIHDVKNWPMQKKLKELDYMLKTIKSSWEFVDYTFEITGVSRAFTHQLVRTRDGSYAQQSQRTVDMSDAFEFVMPEVFDDEKQTVMVEIYDPEDDEKRKIPAHKHLNYILDVIDEGYKDMVKSGIPPQDARSILPTNTATAIIAKFDLRTLSSMAEKRLCTRTQGEYQQVFKAMKEAVIEVHPWAEKFIRVYCSAVGVCQFPNYKECPIKPDIFNPDSGKTWSETEDYKIPANAIRLNQNHCFESQHPLDSGCAKRPATKEEIEIGFRKMKFEATPLWKGNS